MNKPFKELSDKMSPEMQERAQALKEQYMKNMDICESCGIAPVIETWEKHPDLDCSVPVLNCQDQEKCGFSYCDHRAEKIVTLAVENRQWAKKYDELKKLLHSANKSMKYLADTELTREIDKVLNNPVTL